MIPGGRGLAREPGAGVANVRKRIAVVVDRLGEIALAFERCWHAEPIRCAATCGRPDLVAKEEKQLVRSAGLTHGTADSETALIGKESGLRIAILLVHPAISVPFGVLPDVIDRPVELVGTALRHGGDLQPAGSAVLCLVVWGQH